MKKFESSSEAVVNITQRVAKKEERDLKESRDKNLIIFKIPEAQHEKTRDVVD